MKSNDEIASLESALLVLQAQLAGMRSTPRIRELLVIARSYTHTVRQRWALLPPTEKQRAAMWDCIAELQRGVRREEPTIPPPRPDTASQA